MAGVTNSATSTAFMDLDATARKMVDAAVAVTTGQLGLSTPAVTLDQIRQGDPNALVPFRRELARQIAGVIFMLSEHVDAVYEEQMPVREQTSTSALARPFRLWVVARLRSAMLYAQLDQVNEALGRAYSTFGDATPRPVVETLIVDARDGHLMRDDRHWQAANLQLLAGRSDLSQ